MAALVQVSSSRPGRFLVRTASAVVVAALAVEVLTVSLFASGWQRHVPIAYGADLPALLATQFYGTVAGIVGLVLVLRRPSNVVGLLLCATALGESTHVLAIYGAAMGIARGIEPWSTAFAWLSGNLLQPTAGAMVATLMLVFPDGRLLSRAWRPALIAVILGAAARFVETAFVPGPIQYFPSVSNPYAAPGVVGVLLQDLRTVNAGLWVLLAGFGASGASLVVRYGRAPLDVRRQIRWFVLAGVLVLVTLVPLMYLFLFVDQASGVGQEAWVAFFLASALIPLAVGVAITRYRLYEIDRIVNRTVLYAALTALLAGLFTAGIALAQRLFVALTGERSDAAIVLTTFVVATAYAPIRKWLEGVVDRRFKYDRARFGAFCDDVARVAAVIDPFAAGTRLCREAIGGTDAIGAALVDADERPIASAGTWPVPAAVRIPLRPRDPATPVLVVGPRRDGEPHDARVVEELADLTRLIGTIARPAEGSG